MTVIKKTAYIALLIFGELPIVFFALAFAIIGIGNSTTSLFFIILSVLTAISMPGALIIYIVHVYKKSTLENDRRHLWAALLLFGNLIVYPFYWYLYMWRSMRDVNEQLA